MGTVVANRALPETHALIGMFANLIVLRLDVEDRSTFAQLAAAANELLLTLQEHADLPYETLVEHSDQDRDPRFAPLFQIAFDVRDQRLNDSGEPDIDLKLLGCDVGRVQYDLHLTIEPARDGTTALWSYNSDLFDASTIERLAQAYVEIATAAAADPEAPVARLPLLAPEERDRLLHQFNATAVDVPTGCVHEQFLDNARARPAAVALRFDGRDVTYAELEGQSARIAGALAAAEVRRGDLVAVALERGPELIAAFLGVLRIGAAFVPIDPAYPSERVQWILHDAGCRAVLVSADTCALAGTLPAVDVTAAFAAGAAAPDVTLRPDELA